MRTVSHLFAAAALVATTTLVQAHDPKEPPVPVTVGAPQQMPAVRGEENQRLYGPAGSTIIPAEQAQALVSRFREAYAKLGSPRLVFHINRDLVDSSSGLKLTGRTEKYDSTTSEHSSKVERPEGTAPAAGNAAQTEINISINGKEAEDTRLARTGSSESSGKVTRTSGENTYTFKEGEKLTLSDKQTTREVERLFGRVFRAGGALLADQKAASALLEDKPVSNLTGTSDQAAKDREALAKVADVAIEILVSSRTITINTVSGEQQLVVPDIQATAIRLSDAAVLAQAAATDILGKDANAARLVQNFDVRDITEATALALMEDMVTHVK